jgi:hypothetical protein
MTEMAEPDAEGPPGPPWPSREVDASVAAGGAVPAAGAARAEAGGDLAPAIAEAPDDGLAPALGTPPGRGGRAWWRSLKGPIAVLIADLEATSPLVRRRAAEALVRLGDRRAVPALALAARDPAVEVRRACVRALGRLGGDGAAVALRRSMRDAHPAVRLAAAEGLAGLGDAAALPLLEELARHLAAYGSAHERERAAAAIARLRDG